MNKAMKVVWLARAFLDYRAPVIEELYNIFGNNFFIFVSKKWMPPHILDRLLKTMGDNVVVFDGEVTIGTKNLGGVMANSAFRLPIQPGLMGELNRIDPTVILGDGFFQWTAYGYIYKLYRKATIVVCYERTAHTERNSQWYRNIYRKWMIRNTDAFCVNGSLSREYLVSLGCEEKFLTEGYMVHEDKAVGSTRLPRGERNYLFVGQLIERKGIVLLVKAWAKVMSGSESSLVVVGDGELFAWLEHFIHENQIKNIVLVGSVPHTDISVYYLNACALIVPTLEDNWSLVVPEAMSHARTVMTTIYNGCYPELIRDGSGFLFDPQNFDDFCTALEYLDEKTLDELEIMGRRCKEIVKKRNSASAAKAIADAILLGVARV